MRTHKVVIMKKYIIILGLALFVIFGCTSCIKRMCKCEATGYASQSQLQMVLDRYGQGGCIEVVENGGYKIDYTGIELYCYEE
jgi:hypothetical protein